jgi:hypothetical protein
MNISALFSKPTAESRFWSWFSKNSDRLYHFDKDQEAIFDELSTALKEYKDGIVFEISAEKDKCREFILSADGISDLFPHVSALAKAAPVFKKWKIMPFRPRMADYTRFSLEYAGYKFEPNSIWFHSRTEDDSFDVIFYHSGLIEEDRNKFVSGTYILLDMAIGEYDVVTGIRYIDHQVLPDNPKAEGLKPFSEFRLAFDTFKQK